MLVTCLVSLIKSQCSFIHELVSDGFLHIHVALNVVAQLVVVEIGVAVKTLCGLKQKQSSLESDVSTSDSLQVRIQLMT